MVGVRQCARVRDVDLVLALAELALAELHRDPGAQHPVADLPEDPLVASGLEHVVVHDVRRARAHVPVSPLGGHAIRVLEQVELELGARLDRVAPLDRTLDLTFEDPSGRDLDGLVLVLLVVDVADDHHGLLDPRTPSKGRQIGDHSEVPVARLPARVLVPGEGLHLHVDRQQVEARVQTLLTEDLLEEEMRNDALAHEAPLEVGEHAQDGVDLARAGQLLELLDVKGPLVHAATHLPSEARARRP